MSLSILTKRLRRRPLVALVALAVVVALGALAAGCGGDDDSASASSTSSTTAATHRSSTTSGAPSAAATVKTAKTSLGTVLVDQSGRTLYFFGKDTGTQSQCTGACATQWPPDTMQGTPTAGSGVNKSMLGTTQRSDGTTQVTYNGHPVYRFLQDTKAGDVNGEGINAFGGVWYAAGPDGNNVLPSSAGSGSSSGTPGY
jgi:predicted lipoprotein with Yx(FWY)xxD motif